MYNKSIDMAYISNTTKQPSWGLNLPKSPQFPGQNMQTANSTPATRGVLNIQSVINNSTNGNAGPQSKLPSTNSPTGTSSTSNFTTPPTQPQDTIPTPFTPTTPVTSPALTGENTGTKGLLDAPTQNNEPSQFSSFLSGLMGSAKPSKAQKKYLIKLEKAAKRNEQIANDARNTSEMYGGEIQRVGQLGAGAVAGARTTGTDVVGRGNANIAAESASNRMNALSAGLAAELQGTQQQLTGANQEAAAFNNALTGANTQQQLGISALGQGAQIAAPSTAQYGQTVFDPATGQYTGGNLDPQTQATNLAQQVMSGNMTYDQALASLGYAGNAGTNFLNNAITGQGGNALELQAQGAGQQANISTQTTAGTDIARQGLGQATQDYVQMNTAAQFANEQASAVSNILEQTGLNNISSTDYNKALNNLKGRFSDVNFASLNTALQEAQIAYTNLLSTGGGTPSGREEAAINTLNIAQSAAAINASIQELENAVSRRLQAQYGALQQYNQNLGSGGMMGGGQTGGEGQWDW